MSDNTPTVLKPGVYTIEGGHGSFMVPLRITDEMIERGAMVLEQRLWASASFSHDMSEAVLRAALEVEHE